jgi:hypothetical protein
LFSIFKLNQFWIASRLVYSSFEAMAGSLSVASTTASLAKVAVVRMAGLQCIAGIIMSLVHCLGI